MKKPFVFIAGIIQGSMPDDGIHPQDYRGRIRSILETHLPGAQIYCPVEHHPDSLSYDDEKASRVFFDHIEMAAREADLVVAFVPSASMGTAVEMYAAREAGRLVVTVSPLSTNWTVRYLSDRLFDDIEAFEKFAASGALSELMDEHSSKPGS
jgi:hypothetical protein